MSRCEGCGVPFTPTMSAEPDAKSHCLACRERLAIGTYDAATAAADILRGAVSAALAGHLSPQDALTVVGEEIMRMQTAPVATCETLHRELGRLREKREAT